MQRFDVGSAEHSETLALHPGLDRWRGRREGQGAGRGVLRGRWRAGEHDRRDGSEGVPGAHDRT
jgi:hypothetical protein